MYTDDVYRCEVNRTVKYVYQTSDTSIFPTVVLPSILEPIGYYRDYVAFEISFPLWH